MDPDLLSHFQKAKDALAAAERAMREHPHGDQSRILSILLAQQIEVVPYLCYGLARTLGAWPIDIIRGISSWSTPDMERLVAAVGRHSLQLTVQEIRDWAEKAVVRIREQSGQDIQKFANFMLGETLN